MTDGGLATSEEERFVPALGHRLLTPLYDPVVRLATREAVWRTALVEQIAPQSREVILDVGCGTGSLALLMKRRAPSARIVGLDPDPEALAIAGAKARDAGLEIEWRRGFARDATEAVGSRTVDKVVSSLVFHQVPVVEKRAGLLAMFKAARAGGSLHVADFARQPTRLMRALFMAVGRLDGIDNTRPNADGILERLLAESSGHPVAARQVIPTLFGAISLFACPVTGSELAS